MVEACCPAFPVPEPVQVPGLGLTARTNLARISKIVRIYWPVPSSDMSTIGNVKDFVGQRVQRIILAPRNLQALNVIHVGH